MKTHTKTLLTAFAASALLAGSTSAATIASFDFTTDSDPNIEAVNTSTSTMNPGTGWASGGSASSGRSSISLNYFGRGPSTTPATSYVGFTVAADSGFSIDLTQLAFDYLVSQDPTTNTFTFEVRSDVDGFTSAIPGTYSLNPVVGVSSNQTASLNLSGGSYDGLTSIEFRLYATNDTQQNFNDIVRWDNIVLTGDVVAVPEPSSLALLGLGGLAVLRRRG